MPAAEAAELLELLLLSVLVPELVLVRVPVLREVDEVTEPPLAVDAETEVEVDSDVMVDWPAEPVADPDADEEPDPVSEAEPEGAEVSVAEGLLWVMPRFELNWLAKED